MLICRTLIRAMISLVLLPVLPALRARHPGIEVDLIEDSAEGIAQRVQAGLVDFGVGAAHPAGGELVTQPLLSDAMGLVAFSLIGCEVALKMDYATPVVIMAGMITGIFGGILRDVLCNQVPVVFRRELYASVSMAVCLLFLALRAWDVEHNLSTAVCFVGGLALRLAAIRWHWRLPVFSYQQRWE